jgi:hypothetical protein
MDDGGGSHLKKFLCFLFAQFGVPELFVAAVVWRVWKKLKEKK